jgi:cation-transporting ATPase 13A1
MPSELIDNSVVKSSQLLKARTFTQRPYIAPFVALYPWFFQIYYTQYDRYIGGQEWTFVYLGAIISLQALLLLMPHWNVNVDALFNYSKTDNLDEATYILIHTTPNNGASSITKISRDKYADELQVSFLFQKRRFIYHQDINQFSPPIFTVDQEPKLSVYKQSNGHW